MAKSKRLKWSDLHTFILKNAPDMAYKHETYWSKSSSNGFHHAVTLFHKPGQVWLHVEDIEFADQFAQFFYDKRLSKLKVGALG